MSVGPHDNGQSSDGQWPIIEVDYRPGLFSIAMLTAARPVSTVQRSIAELRRAGFPQTVHLFAEPDCSPDCDSTVRIRTNRQHLGAWRNWLHAARTMLRLCKTPFILICEDDIQLAECAALALQHAFDLLPHGSLGYASLYTPQQNVAGPWGMHGWKPIQHGSETWGALAWCFTRQSLEVVLQSEVVRAHGGDQDTDIVISDALYSLSRHCYCHVPSLCQHIGAGISALGHVPLRNSTAVEFSHQYGAYVARKTVREAHVSSSADVRASSNSFSVKDNSVTVVIPTYNCGPWLRDCIQSLKRQTARCEIAVVDDGSTDNTRQVLREFAGRIQLFRHEENQGANMARRTGLVGTKSTWVLFADADAIYEPRFIEQLLHRTVCGASVVYCSWRRRNLSNGHEETIQALPFDPQRLWWHNYISMCSLVRRTHLPASRTGRLADSELFDDWSLWLDLASNGRRFAATDDVLFSALERPEGKTSFLRSHAQRSFMETARLRRMHPRLIGLREPLAVVIPAKDCLDLTKECLWHLARYSGLPLHVIYVDNASCDNVAELVSEFATFLGLNLTAIGNERNEQFTAAVNQGIRHAGESHVICLNNDCFVGPECIERMYFHMQSGNDIAAIGPLTGDYENQSLRNQVRQQHANVIPDRGFDYADAVEGFKLLHGPPRARDEPTLAFFCTLLNRRAINSSGPLDEQTRAFRCGLGADDEWCHRARTHGWRLRLALDAYAVHLGGRSFRRLGLNRPALQREALEAFRSTCNA